MKNAKRKLALVGWIVVLTVFLLRELRFLWGVPMLDVFDLSRHGIPHTEGAYEWLNGFAIGTSILSLYHLRRRTPDIPSSRSERRSPVSDPRSLSSSGRERISDPKAFEDAVPSWRLVKHPDKEGT